ncbi:hypothetical protein GGI13_000807 [Coemansia sp. RSA 455]|nr:hypothetical protein GGI13_000807 [Coemansia sp. RSA 455]
MNVLVHQSSSRTSTLIGALGFRRAALTRSASVLAQGPRLPRHSLNKHTYPFTSSGGEPEIIDRLQYILRPIAKSSNHIADTQRDTRQLFDELQTVVTMAARTLDTLTQMKSRLEPKTLHTGGRTIEVEISAADLHKILMLAAAARHGGGTGAETQQPQQPVGASALLKSAPCRIDAANCNSSRFASTCASREPGDNAQHSAGILAAVAVALFGTGAALEHQEEATDKHLHMSPVDVSNILACVQ